MHSQSDFTTFVKKSPINQSLSNPRHQKTCFNNEHSAFFNEEQSDLQKVVFILQTYSQTGRIILNPRLSKRITCSGSYIAEFDEHNPSINLGNHFRPSSPLSHSFWTDEKKFSFRTLWMRSFEDSPNTVLTIKALLFVQQHRPDISDVNFLFEYGIIKTLSDAYDLEGDHNRALAHLEHLKSVNIDYIKSEIKKKLLRYIESRGAIEGNQFIPNRASYLFREPQVTEYKINLALRLINKIEGENQMSVIKTRVIETKNLSEERFPCKFFKSHLTKCMDECLELIRTNDETIRPQLTTLYNT